MRANLLTDKEKKELIKKTLEDSTLATGNHFPAFSKMMDGLGHVNDALSLAELIPALNVYLSGTVVGTFASGASFAGYILFPFQQIINLINANETGFLMYSYRAISYAITAWSFDKPVLSKSTRTISNLKSGSISVVKSHNDLAIYHKTWWEASTKTINGLKNTCIERNIQPNHLKAIFKSFGDGKPEKLCHLLLTGFESQFGHTTKHIWRSTYSIVYPQ